MGASRRGAWSDYMRCHTLWARIMFTVALIGPDGAGKTTVARELQHAVALPTKYLYMGVNWDASNHLLPTTRLVQAVRRARNGRPAPERGPGQHEPPPPARGWPKRALGGCWQALSLANRISEEWYRQLVAWSYVRRGVIVVCDRHFFSDYHAHDIAGARRTMLKRVHGFVLAHGYPRPALAVYLDAPPELLLARKGEGTLESLEQLRQDYLALASEIRHFVTVDASRPLGDVVHEVAAAIESFAASNRRGS
jgi:thymidylate kinase